MMWCKKCREAVDPIERKDIIPHWELDDGNILETTVVYRCPCCLSVVEDAGRCEITDEPCDPDKNLSEEMFALFGDYLEPALVTIGEHLTKMGYNFSKFKIAGLAEDWLDDYVE